MSGKVCAIIVAAGNSTRMGGIGSKQFLKLGGMTVIERTLTVFESAAEIDEIVIAARAEDAPKISEIAANFIKFKAVVNGAETRQGSVKNALSAVSEGIEYVAIHDGARPLITEEIIDETVFSARAFGAAACGVPVKDTIKVVFDGDICDTPQRSSLWAVQTPQVFKKSEYLLALTELGEAASELTDDCRVFELTGRRVRMTQGSYGNIKITTPDDMIVAENILISREK